jgi:hypothetical protein
VPEKESDNENWKRVDGELHPSEAVEDKIALSDRFGLWLSFYPFTQEHFLNVVEHWIGQLAARPACSGNATSNWTFSPCAGPPGAAIVMAVARISSPATGWAEIVGAQGMIDLTPAARASTATHAGRNWSRCWPTSGTLSPMPRSFRRFCSTSSMT